MTATVPVPAGLSAVIVVSLTTTRAVAAVVPKSTTVVPVKPVPVIVTGVPPAVVPLVGLQPGDSGCRRRRVSELISGRSGRGAGRSCHRDVDGARARRTVRRDLGVDIDHDEGRRCRCTEVDDCGRR